MIFVENLSKKFDDFTAVNQISFEVGKGEVLALLGPNGAGKTTTIRMLTSILKPSGGRTEVAGFDVVKNPKQVRQRVGVLTEHHGLYSRMKASEYLDFFGQLYGMTAEDRHARIDQLLDEFNLGDSKERRIGEFSKGMRQKLALARAMIHRPEVLLLDEPTSAMDPESARLVRDSIKQLRSEERTVMICTHNLGEAEELADRIAIIRRGEIISTGSVPELKTRLLGPPVYQINFADNLNDQLPSMPDGVEIHSFQENQLRVFVHDPQKNNPDLIKQMVAQDLKVVSVFEVPRNLEQVYLRAVGLEGEKDAS